MDEEWRPVVGYEGLYDVSSYGRVRTVKRKVSSGIGMRTVPAKIRTPTAGTDGYLRMSLCDKSHFVHTLVARAFIGERPNESDEVCHNDGDMGNNHATNLRYDTKSENRLDAVRHGTHRNTKKDRRPSGHLLVYPNLCPSEWKRSAFRKCLACAKVRGKRPYRRGQMSTEEIARWADFYYNEIMKDFASALPPEPRVRVSVWTVAAIPDEHPDRHLYTLEIEDMCNRGGGPSFRVGRRLGPHALCRIDEDVRGLAECSHRPWCQWPSFDLALAFARRIAPTIAVVGDYDEATETQQYIDVAQAMKMGSLE